MALQPSASRTSLFLACPRPFAEGVELEPDPPGEPALYGNAFHEVIAACLRSPKSKPLEKDAPRYARAVDRAVREHDVKHCAQELAGHVKGSVKVLRSWLKREKLNVVEVEKPYAIQPVSGGGWTVRSIPPYDGGHRYKVDDDEIPGTVDLVVEADNGRMVVIDHKTGMFEDWYGAGEMFARPTTVAQLRTLGLAKVQAPPIDLAIFHADRKGLPIVYDEPYERAAQFSHAADLYEALRRRKDGGFLRPGEQCAHCPARVGCPARAAALLVESAEVLTDAANKMLCEPIDPKALYVLPTEEITAPGVIEERAGALYKLIKRFRALDKVASEEIKRLVRGKAVIETSEGKVLAIQTQTYETLSKKSVLEAFGKVAGERELKRLRAKGAIVESTRDLLVEE